MVVIATYYKSIYMKPAAKTIYPVQSKNINRVAYILFLVLVTYLVIVGDYQWAVTNLGIALVFDPFDPSVKWQKRPFYQKVWLLCHLILFFTGFIFLVVLQTH